MIRESWEEKGGCPATDSGALPPESKDLEVPVADLKAQGNNLITAANTVCQILC